MANLYRVLVVDGDYNYAALICEFLRAADVFAVDLALDIQDMWDHLAANMYDIILLAESLAGERGIGEILRQLAARNPLLPVIVIGNGSDERLAVQAIAQGAADYVVKQGEFLTSLPALIPKIIQSHPSWETLQNALERSRRLENKID